MRINEERQQALLEYRQTEKQMAGWIFKRVLLRFGVIILAIGLLLLSLYVGLEGLIHMSTPLLETAGIILVIDLFLWMYVKALNRWIEFR